MWWSKSLPTDAWGPASGTATSPVPPPPPTPIPPSPDNTVVTTTTGKILDAHANIWTITVNGQVAVNGLADTTTASVIELAYEKGVIWQENSAKMWWSKSLPTDAWGPASGTATSPVPTIPDTLTLRMSEDAYQGDAQFTVSVDGHQAGNTLTASALHATGDANAFILTGNWGQGAHDVKIQFLNDAYGGTAATDRNLYVNSIAYDGKTYAGTTAALMGNGAVDFTVSGSTATAAGPADTLTVHLAEDAWNGDAKFTLSIDGKTISTAQPVTASHAAGVWQDLTFSGNFGVGTHDVGINYANDAYGGSASTDRNLYVNGVDFDGTHYGAGITALLSNGTAHFTI
jgi:hypothetical protein